MSREAMGNSNLAERQADLLARPIGQEFYIDFERAQMAGGVDQRLHRDAASRCRRQPGDARATMPRLPPHR